MPASSAQAAPARGCGRPGAASPSPARVVRPAVPPMRKPRRAHVGSGPDQVSDSLEAEHRVINKKRDRVDPVIGIGSSGGDKRAHRASFGDSFLENLPVFGFLVIKERVHVHRLVELADAGINADLAEQRLHAEGPRFVGNDRHDQLADFRIAQQLSPTGERKPWWSKLRGLRCLYGIPRSGPLKPAQWAWRALCAPACSRPVVCGVPACSDFRTVISGTIERRICSSSSAMGIPKRERNTRSSSSFSFFCWWVMFLPSPASPRP